MNPKPEGLHEERVFGGIQGRWAGRAREWPRSLSLDGGAWS